MGISLSFEERTPLNLAVNLIRIAVMALIGLILVPFYIDKLGMAAYGIIPLATTISSYIMILTDSLSYACMRYSIIAIHDKPDASQEISTSFYGIGRACLLAIPLIIIFSYCTPWIFGIGNINADEVRIMFFFILTSSLLIALSASFYSVFAATNSSYRYDAVRTVYFLLQAALILILFNIQGPSLVNIGVAYMVSAVFCIVGIYLLAKRSYPKMRLSYSLYDGKLFKTIGNLGFWNIIDRVGGMLFFQASLVIINIMIGTEFGGRFAILTTVIAMINTLCYSVTATVTPHVYRLFTDGHRERMIDIFASALKLMVFVIGVPTAFLAVYSTEVLNVWIGPKSAEGLYILLSIVVLFNFAFALSTILEDVPAMYLKVKRMASVTIFFGTINIIATVVVLALGFGMTGVVWACAICMLIYGVSRIYVNQLISETTRTRFVKYVAYCAIVTAAFVGLFYGIRSSGVLGPSFLPALLLFLLVFFVFGVVAIRLFSKDEKKMLESILPGFAKNLFIRLFE